MNAVHVTDGRPHDSVRLATGIALCRAAGCVVTASTTTAAHLRADSS
ncbi:hypothetical protein [Microtetraspora malaysiensis]|uniref:Uncharacterized protein n=1 Tax=Microtetraspora malaysiensis TaxID=161358 RepID=A0ABW6SWN5_9ACTN